MKDRYFLENREAVIISLMAKMKAREAGRQGPYGEYDYQKYAGLLDFVLKHTFNES